MELAQWLWNFGKIVELEQRWPSTQIPLIIHEETRKYPERNEGRPLILKKWKEEKFWKDN